MPNYKLLIEYDGRNFEGWQKQKRTENTVQHQIEKAAEVYTRINGIKIVGAGRTDSGVSAKEQVAHFRSQTELDPDEFVYSVNSLLPREITILKMEPAAEDFHARYSASAREYVYACTFRRRSIDSDFYYYIKHDIDLSEVMKFLNFAVTLKCFRSFCKNVTDKHNFACSIEYFKIEHYKADQSFLFRIKSDRFLHSMIRALTGCALDIGRGRFELSEVIAAGISGEKMNLLFLPPKPLILNKIYY